MQGASGLVQEHDRMRSWVVWQEDGRTPDGVIELLSATTETADRGEKMRIYAKLLREPEYYLFDPLAGTFSTGPRNRTSASGQHGTATVGVAATVRAPRLDHGCPRTYCGGI